MQREGAWQGTHDDQRGGTAISDNWQLVLEQKSDLSIKSGSTAAGADLRVYLTTPTYEETLYFQQTYAGAGDAFAGHYESSPFVRLRWPTHRRVLC